MMIIWVKTSIILQHIHAWTIYFLEKQMWGKFWNRPGVPYLWLNCNCPENIDHMTLSFFFSIINLFFFVFVIFLLFSRIKTGWHIYGIDVPNRYSFREYVTAFISGFSKWRQTTTGGFGISGKNRLNHPRGKNGNKYFWNKIFFFKKPNFFAEKPWFLSHKKMPLRKIFLKNPRGWFWWFFSLMSNLPVDFHFQPKVPEMLAV